MNINRLLEPIQDSLDILCKAGMDQDDVMKFDERVELIRKSYTDNGMDEAIIMATSRLLQDIMIVSVQDLCEINPAS